MSLPVEFWEQLPSKTDEQLYEILARPDDYLPEALSAAEQELGRRNLPPQRMAELQSSADSATVADEAKAKERLGWGMRMFIAIVICGLPGVCFAIYYDSKGYKRKAQDAWITMIISFVAHIALGFLIHLVTLP